MCRTRMPSIRVPLLLLVSIASMTMLGPATASAAPGAYSQANVDAAIANGVAYFDALQNPDGSFGSSVPVAETSVALGSYGVMANGNFSSLPASYQAHAIAGINWLLAEQDATSGAWLGYQTYYTGLALTGLSFFTGQPGVQTAIDKGRAFLVGSQKAPPNFACSSTDPGITSDGEWCGGWDYDKTSNHRSDESNTGFALTGLELTGGVPAASGGANIGWQRHVQEVSSNPFATLNNGGGSYEPGETYSPFRSNANDTGSLLFGYAYDGVAAGDAGAQAAIAFANAVFDEYETVLPTRTMLAYQGATLGGPCALGGGCDWFDAGDGGYHYSIFALSKGLGQYIDASLTDGGNFYAKAVDLLLGEQGPGGSWPQDGRDDGTQLIATGFAVLTLGKVGQKVPAPAAAAAAPAPIAAKPTAKASIRGSKGCAKSTFTARVTGTQISKVSFSLDGGKASVDTKSPFKRTFNVKKLKKGKTHRVKANVTFKQPSTAKSTTKRVSFQRCARKAVKPKFTG